MKGSRLKPSASKANLFFKPGKIEEICLEELKAVDLLPMKPGPIRIDRFIEKRFNIYFEFEDLPNGVLGFTKFGANGVEAIIVSKILSDEGNTSDRRLSTTLAHEAGHALLHAGIFDASQNETSLSLDGLDTNLKRILCREEGIMVNKSPMATKSGNSYLEVHANRAIGGFLLPKPLVNKALESILTERGLLGTFVLEADRRIEAERLLSSVFEVNPIVAKIRLHGLYPESNEAQMTL